MTDLEQRIFRIVTSTRVQADIPGAILAEIERTHCLVERDRWERIRLLGELSGRVLNFRLPVTWPTVWDYTNGEVKMSGRIDPGDLEPIRHLAADSDTSETPN